MAQPPGDKRGVSVEESSPLLSSGRSGVSEVRVYARRWYVLGVFCFLSFLQNCMWNTFGPVAEPAKRVFHWSDAEISLLANWGSIAYIPMLPIVSVLLDKQGLGLVLRLGAGGLLLASTLRCITSAPFTATLLINAAQIINGLVGPIALAGPPVLSSVWFPPAQRTMATAIGCQVANLGVAASFLIGPFIVPDRSRETPHNHSTNHTPHNHTPPHLGTADPVDGERMLRMMCVEATMAALLFLLVCVYCPSTPPHPPSISAGTSRVDYRQGLVSLAKMRGFWLIALAYGISNGVLNGWSSNLDLILRDVDVGEEKSGWIGFLMSVISSVLSILLGCVIAARCKKCAALLLCVGTTLCFLVFLLAQLHMFHASVITISVLIITGNTMCQCAGPLYYEMCVENTFPIAEGISSAALTLPNNLVSIVVLMVPLLTTTGSTSSIAWMTHTLVAACFISSILTALFRDRNQRSAVDQLQIDTGTAQASQHVNNPNAENVI